jgi:hypothetical protein
VKTESGAADVQVTYFTKFSVTYHLEVAIAVLRSALGRMLGNLDKTHFSSSQRCTAHTASVLRGTLLGQIYPQ